MAVDKEGFILLEKAFTTRGFDFVLVKDFKDGWFIYKKSCEGHRDKYELIRPRKQKERIFRGKVIPDKWKYPSDEDFGSIGFDCISLEKAIERHDQIIKAKQDKEDKENTVIHAVLPRKEFTCRDLIKLNPRMNYSDAYSQIKNWLTDKTIIKIGERKNKKGKASILYKIKN